MVSFLRVSCSVVGLTPITGMWKTQKTLEPRELTKSETRLLSPLMTEEMVITVVTPMTMPRMVSPERSLFARSVSSAILMDSLVCPWAMKNQLLASAASSQKLPFLHLRSERHHRVQPGGFAGRVDAEEDAHGAGHERPSKTLHSCTLVGKPMIT